MFRTVDAGTGREGASPGRDLAAVAITLLDAALIFPPDALVHVDSLRSVHPLLDVLLLGLLLRIAAWRRERQDALWAAISAWACPRTASPAEEHRELVQACAQVAGWHRPHLDRPAPTATETPPPAPTTPRSDGLDN